MMLTEAANRLGLDTGKLLNVGIGTNNDNSSQRYIISQIKRVCCQEILLVDFRKEDYTEPPGLIG